MFIDYLLSDRRRTKQTFSSQDLNFREQINMQRNASSLSFFFPPSSLQVQSSSNFKFITEATS